jgi:hypothetical protein
MRASETTDYHAARLLILIDAFTDSNERFDGLTKLAKLDFLLRYPVLLERLLEKRKLTWTPLLEPTISERSAVESRMIRHKYGPWDNRYYPLLGSLVSRDLVTVSGDRTGLAIRLTATGRRLAGELADTEEWRTVAGRSRFLKRHFNSTGNKLKLMIYAGLPDVVDRPRRSVI